MGTERRALEVKAGRFGEGEEGPDEIWHTILGQEQQQVQWCCLVGSSTWCRLPLPCLPA